MKIFQIGFSRCPSSVFINQFCIDMGFKCISFDNGNLIRQMLENKRLNHPLLLGDYERFDYYGDMENLDIPIQWDMDMIPMLLEQYDSCKFIFNYQDDLDSWIQFQMENDKMFESKSLSWFNSINSINSTHQIKNRYHELWKIYSEHVSSLSLQHPNRFIIFTHNLHPFNLYIFLNPIEKIYHYFEYLYQTHYCHRVHSSLHSVNTSQSIQHVDVYCPVLPERKSYIENHLCRFHNVHYIDAITPLDLRKKHYRKLSTTMMIGPMITYCHLCNYRKEHLDIFHKYTKLCVHLSYLICLRHALEHSQKDVILIFEDDIYFECTDVELNQHIQEFRQSHFDTCYLGFCSCLYGDEIIKNVTDPTINLISLPTNQTIRCKHAIMYKTSYIEKLLGLLLPLSHNSDIELNHANIRLKAKVAIPRRPLVYQNRVLLGTHNDNPIIDNQSIGGLPLFK